MRGLGAGFGLVGLLVVTGIVLFWFSSTQVPTIRKGQEVQKQAEQISGHGPDGLPASESVKLDPKGKNGRTDALVVTDVTAGGALEKYFGLQKGDEIVQIGDFPVRDYPGGDDLATAAVFEAAQRQQALVVRRGGQTLTLTPTPVGIPGR